MTTHIKSGKLFLDLFLGFFFMDKDLMMDFMMMESSAKKSFI